MALHEEGLADDATTWLLRTICDGRIALSDYDLNPHHEGVPRFSLVISTLGRVDELARMLGSLVSRAESIEVIVIDQNEDERLAPVIEHFKPLLDLRCAKASRGLSRARNVGIALSRGEIVAFPDDDCEYLDSSLLAVTAAFSRDPTVGIVSGQLTPEKGGQSSGQARRPRLRVNRWNVWRLCSSATIFVDRSVFARVGGFDEELGLGSNGPWQSGEETDFLLRALRAGVEIRYDGEVRIVHPETPNKSDPAYAWRAHAYGMGMAEVLRRYAYPWWYRLLPIASSAIRAARALLEGEPTRAKLLFCACRGRLRGTFHTRTR